MFYIDATGAVDGAYTNWDTNEPQEIGSEDCVEMRSDTGKWYLACVYWTSPCTLMLTSPKPIRTHKTTWDVG